MAPEASCPSASRAMQFAPVKMVENAASHSCGELGCVRQVFGRGVRLSRPATQSTWLRLPCRRPE
jgi:hypothetical protein